jgi:hypothetical protein
MEGEVVTPVSGQHKAHNDRTAFHVQARRRWEKRHWVRILICGTGLTSMVLGPALTPAWAGACDERLGQTIQAIGMYVPAGQSYAREFVFALRLDCHGTTEVVTVQQSTGHLPVCDPQQQVEVVGTLVWSRTLIDGHYEINNPSTVACVAATSSKTSDVKSQETRSPTPQAPPPIPPPPRAEANVVAPSRWAGRYRDSRGAGDVTATLVRGTYALSGTWQFRTGGGGPLTGSLEAGGNALQFRMENTAPECPGILAGAGRIDDATLIGSYRGRDCVGPVTDGHLELHLQK